MKKVVLICFICLGIVACGGGEDSGTTNPTTPTNPTNPTNPTSGKRIIWRIKQDATGGRTITLGNKFRLGTDITSVVLTTSPSITDYIGAIYNAQDDKWDVIAFVKGFA